MKHRITHGVTRLPNAKLSDSYPLMTAPLPTLELAGDPEAWNVVAWGDVRECRDITTVMDEVIEALELGCRTISIERQGSPNAELSAAHDSMKTRKTQNRHSLQRIVRVLRRTLRDIRDQFDQHLGDYEKPIAQDAACSCPRCLAVRALRSNENQANRPYPRRRHIADHGTSKEDKAARSFP